MRLFNPFGKPQQATTYRFGSAAMDGLNLIRAGALDPEQRAFVAYAAGYSDRAKGQLFQDVWALWETRERGTGYFVEVGAHDGIELSNTYLLEQLGWRGIVADPNPDVTSALRHNRSCYVSTNCVHPVSGLEVEFLVARSNVLSRQADINPRDAHQKNRERGARLEKVKSISLNDLLHQGEAPDRIDFLSIDTEGSELGILSALDFARWNIRAIAVEHNFTPARPQLHDLLTANGYRRKWPDFSYFDDWYLRV